MRNKKFALIIIFIITIIAFIGLSSIRQLSESYPTFIAEQFNPDFPRVAEIYLRNPEAFLKPVVLDALAKFDYVMVSGRIGADTAELRIRNPNIKIAPWISADSVWENAQSANYPWEDETEMLNNLVENNWFMYREDATPVTTWLDTNYGLRAFGGNMTEYCPINQNGEKFQDWMPRYYYNRIEASNADFLNIDAIYAKYAWLKVYANNITIDVNNDGYDDPAEVINPATIAGFRTMFGNFRSELASRGKEDFVVTGNGDAYLFKDLLNGAYYENFLFSTYTIDPGPNPYSYKWANVMLDPDRGYLTTEHLYRQPNVNFLMAQPFFAYGGTETTPPNNELFLQYIRFSLGSALLGDGYFGITAPANVWYLDQYYEFEGHKGYLGKPKGAYQQTIVEARQGAAFNGKLLYGIYEREFDYGRVIVNASGFTQNVSLPEDIYYFNVPDKNVVSGFIQIDPWDARILVADKLRIAVNGERSVVVSNRLSFDIQAYSMGDVTLEFTAVGLPQNAVFYRYKDINIDVNGDGVFDLVDISLFALVENNELSNPEIKARCDFNADGLIDDADFAIFDKLTQPGEKYNNVAGFDWIPSSKQVGQHSIIFSVRNVVSGESDAVAVTLTVIDNSSGQTDTSDGSEDDSDQETETIILTPSLSQPNSVSLHKNKAFLGFSLDELLEKEKEQTEDKTPKKPERERGWYWWMKP